jgi:hypothetical protein
MSSFIEEAQALVKVNGRARDYLKMLDELEQMPTPEGKALAQNFLDTALANLRKAVAEAEEAQS